MSTKKMCKSGDTAQPYEHVNTLKNTELYNLKE